MYTTNKKSIPRIFKLYREEKDEKKIFWKKLILRPVWKLKNGPNHVFFDFFENLDLFDVQISIKHWKINENLKFQFFWKTNPKPFVSHRFHQNPSTSAISTAVWKCMIFRILGSIFRNVPKSFVLDFGICIWICVLNR